MPRSIWGGAISFGLVNVPVKLVSAVSPKDVRFHQLDAKSNARVKQKRVSAETGDEVNYEDIVKGYEIAPDQYVTVTPDELDGVPHDVDVSDRELKIARQLIESLATEFEPERYRDEYRERVLDLIEKKAEGQEIVLQPQTEEPAQVVDLMAALEASLAAVKEAKNEKPAPKKKK